jgi:hypothetical protein
VIQALEDGYTINDHLLRPARAGGSKGDQYVTLNLVLPQKPDPQLEKFVAQWEPVENSPRRSMGV